MTNSDRSERVAELVESALEREAAAWPAFLDDACAGDAALRAEVESLLRHHTQAQSFIEAPVFEMMAGAVPEERDGLTPGQKIDNYEILSLLGEGGMGEVYLARDAEVGRSVAIKLLKLGLSTSAILRRFRTEERILANLNHPHIARFYGYGTTKEGRPYFVMEYVEGQSIHQYCNTHKLSTRERLQLFRKVCAAVHYSHQRLIIHRDIKPGNIIVTEEGAPKLLDFGIAKLAEPTAADGAAQTVTQLGVMTPEYASPEQIKGEAVTTATDIYSLGVLLYELLTDQRPYRVKSRRPDEIAQAVLEQEPEKPSTAAGRPWSVVSGQWPVEGSNATHNRRRTTHDRPRTNPQSAIRNPKSLRGDLDNIVLMAMRKEVARRYLSVEQFAEDIRRHLEGLPVMAQKDTFGYRAGKFIGRHKAGVAAAALVALALVTGIVATAWQARIARLQRARAEQRFNDVRQLANSFMFELHDSIQNLPGSTPARQLLVSRALQYLDSLAREASDDPSLQRELATAYEKLGDIQGNPYSANLGDIEGALQSYRKALAIRESLIAVNPTVETQKELGKSYRSLADILEQKGDIAACVENFRKSLGIFERLSNANPSDQDGKAELARAYEALGDGLRRSGDITEKLQSYRKSLAIREELLGHRPHDRKLQRSVAISFMKLGDAWVENKTEAVESLRKSVAILESLAASDPTNGRAQRDLATTYNRFGEVLDSIADHAGALQQYQKAFANDEKLSAEDPKNMQARFDTAGARKNMAEALVNSGDMTQGIDNARKALLMYQDLVAADPANMVYLRNLGLCYGVLANAHSSLGSDGKLSVSNRTARWREARDWYEKELNVFADLRNRGALRPTDKDKPGELAVKIKACDEALEELRGSGH